MRADPYHVDVRKTLATSAIACMASGLVGQTGFGSQQVITFAANYARSVYATDLDGDGDADVLSASTVDNKIACYFNDGAGNFGPQQVITTGAIGARSVYAADLDGDGDMDVLSASGLDNKVAWYENSYTSPLTSTATPFGAGCGAPAMALTPFSTAITGQLTTGKVTNTPTSSCVIAGGTSNTNAPGLGALPFDLSIAGMTGCTLYQSAEVFGLPTVGAAVAGEAYFSLYIPSDPLLVGQHIYLQAFSIAPGANLLQVISSNGIDFLISNQ